MKCYLPRRLFPISPWYHFIPFCFVVELEHASHLGLRPLSEKALHRQEAARAYKHGCKAAGAPAKWLFLKENELWTLHKILRGVYRMVCEEFGIHLAMLHSGFVRSFTQ